MLNTKSKKLALILAVLAIFISSIPVAQAACNPYSTDPDCPNLEWDCGGSHSSKLTSCSCQDWEMFWYEKPCCWAVAGGWCCGGKRDMDECWCKCDESCDSGCGIAGTEVDCEYETDYETADCVIKILDEGNLDVCKLKNPKEVRDSFNIDKNIWLARDPYSSYGNLDNCCKDSYLDAVDPTASPVEVFCCEKPAADCGKYGNYENYVVNSEGLCDIKDDDDQRYCGTPTCAGGNRYDDDPDPVERGYCGCINDEPPVYKHPGEIITLGKSAPTTVEWFSATLNGWTNEYTTVSLEYSHDGGATWSNPGEMKDGEKTKIYQIYTEALPALKSDSIRYRLKLSTTDETYSPEVSKVTARSFPRINNAVQRPAEEQCVANEKVVECVFGNNKANCAIETRRGESLGTFLDTTESFATLDTGEYFESNPCDNNMMLNDENWCYQSGAADVVLAEGVACDLGAEYNNKLCETSCCAQPTQPLDAPVCESAKTVKMEYNGEKIDVLKTDDGRYCGYAPGEPCAVNYECSTTCCGKTSSVCIPVTAITSYGADCK